ncbi:MAG: NUDIX hydrolase [Candidatus Rokuibacteriota bacterium]
MSVKPSPPVPVPAASLVLLRDRAEGGVETLLIQRHHRSRFAPGDFVFPGGKIEVEDMPSDAEAWCAGLDGATAASTLGLADPPAALGYWIGAVREAFEEVGVLLAYVAGGRPASLQRPRLLDHRRACQRDHRAFWELLRGEGLTLATDQLVYFAHWITPEERPLRYDTRFFAAPMPGGQDAEADEHEIVAVRWLTPAEALQARARGEISLRLPTVKNLALFDGAGSTVEALARLGGLPVAPIRPRMVTDEDRPRTLLPGDPGYF